MNYQTHFYSASEPTAATYFSYQSGPNGLTQFFFRSGLIEPTNVWGRSEPEGGTHFVGPE